MIKESKRIVKYEELGTKAKMNCVLQFINIICPYDYVGATASEIGENADLFVEATPDQYWFDQNGDWYDEGRKVKS